MKVEPKRDLLDIRIYAYYNRIIERSRMKVSELTKQLKRNGCVLIVHGAEHDKWYSEITGKTFMIPRHPSKEIPTGTVNRILKDAGLN